MICACPGKTKESSSANDVNAGQPAEAGPSNAAPPVAGKSAAEESTVVNSSESESATNAARSRSRAEVAVLRSFWPIESIFDAPLTLN